MLSSRIPSPYGRSCRWQGLIPVALGAPCLNLCQRDPDPLVDSPRRKIPHGYPIERDATFRIVCRSHGERPRPAHIEFTHRSALSRRNKHPMLFARRALFVAAVPAARRALPPVEALIQVTALRAGGRILSGRRERLGNYPSLAVSRRLSREGAGACGERTPGIVFLAVRDSRGLRLPHQHYWRHPGCRFHGKSTVGD